MSFPPPPPSGPAGAPQQSPSGQYPYAQQPAYSAPAYGYPQPAPVRVSEPIVGCLILVAAAVGAIGSFTTWVNIDGLDTDVDGTSGDGKLTLFCCAVAAVMGFLICVRLGRLWTSIVALIFSVFTTLIGLIDLGSISRLYGPAQDLPDDAFSVGFGLWLVIVGGAVGVVLSIVALVRRSATP